MNKKYIISFAIAIALGFGNKALAQTPSVALERQITNQALLSLESLIANMGLRDDESREEYLSLFKDEKVQVYNDLLGISSETVLPVSEYAKLMQKQVSAPQIKMSDVRKGKIRKEDGAWKIDLSLSKSQSYSNKCGLYFSSLDFYNANYDETYTFAYDETLKRCMIEKVIGTVNSTKQLPAEFYVLERTSPRDNNLRYVDLQGNVTPLKFNAYDQVILSGGINSANFKNPDADMIVTPVVDMDCHKVQLQYKPRHWRVKLHYDMPFGYYQVNTDNSNIVSENRGTEFGLDLGYGLVSTNSFRLSLFAGVGFANSSIDFTLNATNDRYDTDADIDGDNYTRIYENLRGNETLKMTHVAIPVYLDAEIAFAPMVSAYLQAGVRNYLKVSESMSTFALEADNVYGYFDKYNLQLDYRWGYDGFMQSSSWNNANNITIEHSSYSVDACGTIGLRIRPVSSLPLYVDLGYNYSYGITDVVTGPGQTTRYVDYTLTNGDVVSALSNAITSVKRQHGRLSVGVMYKF